MNSDKVTDTIRDFIALVASDAIAKKGMPSVENAIEDGVTAIGYEMFMKDMLAFVVKWIPGNDVKSKDILLRFVTQAITIWGVRYLMSYPDASISKSAIKSLIAIVLTEAYNVAVGGALPTIIN
jgi:hypothetical protein